MNDDDYVFPPMDPAYQVVSCRMDDSLMGYLKMHKPKGFTPITPLFNPVGGWVDLFWEDERGTLCDKPGGYGLFFSLDWKRITGVRIYNAKQFADAIINQWLAAQTRKEQPHALSDVCSVHPGGDGFSHDDRD